MTNDSREQATTLERTLGLGSVVLIGLAYMTPLIVLGTYGVVSPTLQWNRPNCLSGHANRDAVHRF
jgi:hypothetical protein